MADGPLRVGLLLDTLTQPAWVAAMLDRLIGSDFAKLCLVVQNAAPRPDRGLLDKLRANRKRALYLLLQRADDRLFRAQPDAFERRDIEDRVAGIPRISVVPRQGPFSDRIEEEDLEAIRRQDVDVFLRLGFRILRGGILQAARYGIWSFHHADNRVNRGTPPGFWEVYENLPTTGSILQVLTEDLDDGLVIDRSWAATDPLSVRRSLNKLYWKSLEFVPRRLKQLHDMGGDAFLRRAREAEAPLSIYSKPLFREPRNAEMLRLFLRHALRNLARKVREQFTVDEWCMMLDVRRKPSTSFRRFRDLLPPPDRLWADPHPVYRDGRYFLFFEEMEYRDPRGRIVVLELDEKGRPLESTPTPVLERAYHLSHPFVFEHAGRLYMIPETAEKRRVECYACVEFPHRWELHGVLMENVNAVDTTLHEAGGRWWMFLNLAAHPGASKYDELHLFHAEHPLGSSWQAHPLNPIVSDVRRARPAGSLFEFEGKLYRPSQDCSYGYGYGIRFNEVLALDEERYEEREVGFAEPDFRADLEGMHTFNSAHRLTVIDVKRRRWRRLPLLG